MYMVFFLLYILCALTCVGVMIASTWIAFSKAGRPGWASIVPIYNSLVFIDIAGKPWWWLFLCMIPLANIYFVIVLCIEFAKNFGFGVGFAIGLFLVPFVFLPLLAFGDAEYHPAPAY